MQKNNAAREEADATRAEMIATLRETILRAQKSDLYRQKLADISIEGLDTFESLPLTTRSDLQNAGLTGIRAAPIGEISHYGESSGTSGATNTTWLTSEDLVGNARRIRDRHPNIFSPGQIILNRFPFMAAPAHLIQLVAQLGGGISIPAGNINWDVPFPRALELARTTQAQVLAGLPIEPIVLERLAYAQGLDPKKDFNIKFFFLGGAPLPPVMQQRIERIWDAQVIELYGSTETMLLGTSCSERCLHLETDFAFCEFLRLDSDEPVKGDQESRLIVTTLGIQGSPLIRFDTGDIVKKLPPCSCGDTRPAIQVLGRSSDLVQIQDRSLYSQELISLAATAANVLDSSVFFSIALPDRILIRIEVDSMPHRAKLQEAQSTIRDMLGDIRFEIECTEPNMLLDVEQISRSPSVYKPVLVSDWNKEGRKVLSVSQGMMEWPAPSLKFLAGWARRVFKSARRRRALNKIL